MSLLELSQFSYKRKERLLMDGKENHQSENRNIGENKLNLTPNKATISCTTIPETPDSFIANSPSTDYHYNESTASHRQQLRRRNRLFSTSDEEDSDDDNRATAVKSGDLKTSFNIFSGLPASKRRKRVEGSSEEKYQKNDETPNKRYVGESFNVYTVGDRRSISTSEVTESKSLPEQLHREQDLDRRHERDLKQLCEMFPQHCKTYLELVLNDCRSTLNEAITVLLADSERSRLKSLMIVVFCIICYLIML